MIQVIDDLEIKENILTLYKGLIKIDVFVSEDKANILEKEYLDIVLIAVTNNCNLRCKHCCTNANTSEELSLQEIKNIIDEVVKLNPRSIQITGGEPMIRNDFKEIMSYLRENYQGSIILTSNLTMLDNENIKVLEKTTDSLSVSLDGYNEEIVDKVRGKGMFKKITDNIIRVRQSSIENLTLSTILSKDTIDEQEKFKKLCEEFGAKSLLRIMDFIGRADENEDFNVSVKILVPITINLNILKYPSKAICA